MGREATIRDGHGWRAASVLVAGSARAEPWGLLLGPTPSNDPAEALRDIHEFRTSYVLTNAIDLVGILITGAGLVVLARLQLNASGGATALIGGVANASGAVIIGLTVVLQHGRPRRGRAVRRSGGR